MRIANIVAFMLNSAGIFADSYTVENVSSNGDCMFASLALGLHRPVTDAHDLRTELVHYLSMHLDEVSNYLSCLLATLQKKYYSELRKDTKFSG